MSTIRLPRSPTASRLLAPLLVALALVLAGSPGARAREVYGLDASQLGLYLGNNLLAGWQVREARRLVDDMLARSPDDPAARALEARVLFFEGRYAEALRAVDGLGVTGPFRDLVAATVEATRDMVSRTGDGFRVSWVDPRDEILADPALEALAAAAAALEEHLGFRPDPDEVIRVEIYPTVASFTAVSTLTRQEVETSGTIGLCKFNRIMITSPRATLWGYRWRDTLCHEYVHLAVYRKSRGLAPIWVHEGIAKYLEGAWRGAAGELEPSSQALLARRMEEGTLIPLEAMSPSVAKLPSAEDTALAFAEVSTMMAFLVERRGPDALRRLVEAIGEGLDDRAALESVWGDRFDTFDAAWRRWVEELPLHREEAQVISLHLADEAGDAEEDPGDVSDPKARDFVRLGDMLRARGRLRAAAAEYAKAYASDPAAPGVASRHALGLLIGKRYDEALDVVDEALKVYPDLPVLWYRKGDALLGLGDPAGALEALDQVLEINPFHLPARRLRVAAFRALGDATAADREARVLTLLAGPPPGHPGGDAR